MVVDLLCLLVLSQVNEEGGVRLNHLTKLSYLTFTTGLTLSVFFKFKEEVKGCKSLSSRHSEFLLFADFAINDVVFAIQHVIFPIGVFFLVKFSPFIEN